VLLFNVSVELIWPYFCWDWTAGALHKCKFRRKLPVFPEERGETVRVGDAPLSKNEQNAPEQNVSKIVRIQKAPLEVVHALR
jgi:hypothetical protein